MDQEKDERLMSLFDGFLKENASADSIPDEELSGLPADYVEAYVKNLPDSPETPAESVIRSKTESLLDAFIRYSAEGPVLPGRDLPVREGPAGMDDLEPLEQEEPDDAFCTETLARIYLKQHRYVKALEIIHSLYLNFPNKSIYFADQIRYLEKLVRINQKTE